MTDKDTVRLRNLCIGYGKRVVAKDINESIRQGELTCLLGPNGVGKSTLLRTLAGFQPKLSGDILINGKGIEEYSRAEMSQIISIVLTEKPSTQNLNAQQIVEMGRAPYTGFWNRCSKEDMEVVDNAISMVNIEGLRHRMVSTLSDGELQKVMIAKALAQQTPVIYLDEPTAFLDYQSKVDLMMLLSRIGRKMQKTIFLSTHDVELALQIADMIWLMGDDGTLVTGKPDELAAGGHLQRFFETDTLMYDKDTGMLMVVK